MKILFSGVVALVLVFVLAPIPASATAYTYNDALGGHVTFNVVGDNLQVTLWSTINAKHNEQVLTAVFFDIAGGYTLIPVSATLPSGTKIINATGLHTPPDSNVGGEWEYLAGLSGLPGGGTRGISSSGFGLFGGPNFGGGDLDPPEAINGGNYGLTGGDILTSPGYGVLVKNTTVFDLSVSGLPTNFDPTGGITDVYIQYGTSLPGTPVPEPATMLLLGSGLIGLAGYGRKKFFKK